jgi:cytochrome c-type biogenesis protein CcmE
VTLERPITAPVPPRRRWGLLLGVALVAAVIGWLAFSGIGEALVYYQTPSELLARGEAAIGQQVRLGGLVKVGSISGPATDLTFVVTDGTHEITVHSTSAPTSSFREGIGAVVEGRLTSSGVFEASRVIVKHDENYVAPSEGEVPSHIPDGG